MGNVFYTHVFTLIHCRPPSHTTSTFIPVSFRAFLPFCSEISAPEVPVGNILNIETSGEGAHITSFQTEIKYGEFVDNAGKLALFGSARNY